MVLRVHLLECHWNSKGQDTPVRVFFLRFTSARGWKFEVASPTILVVVELCCASVEFARAQVVSLV